MATTNTNTDNQNILSTDIYEISEFLDQIRHDNITDLDSTSSMIGIFGYMNEMFSQSMQNSLVVISESVNETIPTRAKFTKNIINHAMNIGVTDINATPAVMTMMIYLPISFIESNFTKVDSVTGRAEFVLSKECPINVGGHEFHLDYDIIFTRVKNKSSEKEKYVYTAMYDLFKNGTTDIKRNNPVSDITNPYITTLMQCTLDRVDYLAFSARLHQVTLTTIEKNILTASAIENKTVTFEFEDQLASFNIDVIENDKVIHLTPIYYGLLDYTIPDGSWCNYTYINENTIRIMFSPDSYVPSMNAVVKINIQTSEGAGGNFTYNNSFKTNLKSETYNNYNGMYAYVYPLLNGVSSNGKDKKTINDIRKIIPREASSRGAVINTTDLNNFFNTINNDECKLYFKKKKDNQFERMYYTYMLMRKNGNVYPTNTLNIKVRQDDFKGFAGNNNLVIEPGTKLYYYDHGSDIKNDFATIIPPESTGETDDGQSNTIVNADGNTVRIFEYTTPFLISIDDDLLSSYLLTVMNENKTFAFNSVNTSSDLQFIATNGNWKRKYKNDNGVYDNKYTLDITMTQNITSVNYNLAKSIKNENGEIVIDKTKTKVKMFMVLYSDETQTNPYRYIEAELIDYDNTSLLYTFRFTIGTDDLMDLNNRINITGVYNCKPEEFQTKEQIKEPENSHGYMNKNTFVKLFILADFGYKPNDIKLDGNIANADEIILYGDDGIGNRHELESIIPTRNDIVEAFLKNDIYIANEDGSQSNIINIIRRNDEYLEEVKKYNNSESVTDAMILKYLRNNINSESVQRLLDSDEVKNVIDSYHCEDLSRYTVCNVLSVDGGIDFYHDYSSMMRSTITAEKIQKIDGNGNLVYREIPRSDALGNVYTECIPVYESLDGYPIYDYSIKRVPLLRYGFLDDEESIQDFIYDLEVRRKYIEECLYVLEDTFDIDFKFFNTYGPSKMFYYDIPSAKNYTVKVAVQKLKVFSSTVNESDESAVLGVLSYGDVVEIINTKGIWGCIKYTYINPDTDKEEIKDAWIKLADTSKITNYIDNVALTMKFALEAQTSADKYIGEDIISDVKEYVEDINNINELHIPNIITLITNNYREQLVYFEFLDVNNYGSACQHLYLDQKVDPDVCPEFLNIDTKIDGSNSPNMFITVY
jgi:hypothetical protein